MRLLVDSDAFCKIECAGLLDDVLAELGIAAPDCRRLPALPYQLQRGGLRSRIGPDLCDRLLTRAESLAPVAGAPVEWLDRFVALSNVDPGEALLLAHAASSDSLLLTGDKRALEAVRAVSDLRSTVSERVLTVEAGLVLLCRARGESWVRERVGPFIRLDTVFRACFAPGVGSPERSLSSYLASDMRRLVPLRLWSPPGWLPDSGSIPGTTSPS
jgi:hypothetical protein